MARWVFIIALFLLAPLAAAQNLLVNGGFEKGLAKNGDPVGWHSHITGVITISEYSDPDHKKGLLYKHFQDGCGYDWGRIRPWPGLVCPKCHQMIATEESGDWYVNNAKWVSLAHGRTGMAASLKMDNDVGSNQGVRLCSDFMKAERGAGYEFGVDAVTKGIGVQVFLECFQIDEDDQEAKDWAKSLPLAVNPNKIPGRLKRTFRGHIYESVGGTWKHLNQQFIMMQNKEHQFDVMYLSLYAYGGAGEAGFDNAFVRRLSPSEMDQYRRSTSQPKDERFR